MSSDTTTSEARKGLPATSCSRIWHGKPCGSKMFRYWIALKGRRSYATPRTMWKPWMKECHCSKCGDPLFPAND